MAAEHPTSVLKLRLSLTLRSGLPRRSDPPTGGNSFEGLGGICNPHNGAVELLSARGFDFALIAVYLIIHGATGNEVRCFYFCLLSGSADVVLA